ncbi:MAG: DUF423 domain-containing protein [Saprospiraceae bacterium]|nr:DUF423 domain-containing protein [Saprospiraceae bacterium]
MSIYNKISCVLIALAIALGAFGAHAWQAILEGHRSTFDTGHLYHLTQAIGLLAYIAIVGNRFQRRHRMAFSFILIGIILFSGSLYLLSFPDIFGGTWRTVLGPVTPVGGLLMIAGWIMAAFSIKVNN